MAPLLNSKGAPGQSPRDQGKMHWGSSEFKILTKDRPPKTDPIAFSEDRRKMGSSHLYLPAELVCNWWVGASWFVSLCFSLSDLHQLCTHKIADRVCGLCFFCSCCDNVWQSQLGEKGVILAQSSRYLAQRGWKGKVAWAQSSWSHGIRNQGVERDEHKLLIS